MLWMPLLRVMALIAGVALAISGFRLAVRYTELIILEPHKRPSRVDAYLPIRGRWLGYLLLPVAWAVGTLMIIAGGALVTFAAVSN